MDLFLRFIRIGARCERWWHRPFGPASLIAINLSSSFSSKAHCPEMQLVLSGHYDFLDRIALCLCYVMWLLVLRALALSGHSNVSILKRFVSHSSSKPSLSHIDGYVASTCSIGHSDAQTTLCLISSVKMHVAGSCSLVNVVPVPINQGYARINNTNCRYVFRYVIMPHFLYFWDSCSP